MHSNGQLKIEQLEAFGKRIKKLAERQSGSSYSLNLHFPVAPDHSSVMLDEPIGLHRL